MKSLRKPLLALFPPRITVEPKVRSLRTQSLSWGVRTLIEYSVTARERIRAYLLLPKRLAPRTAAIIASHQHNGEWHLGKSEPAGLQGDRSMHYGVDLCRRGYVVLCPDHLGFEDRQAPAKFQRPPFSLKDRRYEEFIFADALLHGSSLAAKYVHDLCQAIDVLQSLDFVDPKRIGVFGHSLGGQTAMWLAFYDPRVRVAYSSCGFSTMRSVQKHHVLHNLAAYVPGLLEVGDIGDVISAIAPRAFGMSHGRRDEIFPMSGVREISRKIRAIFPEDRLLTIQFDGPHALPDAVKKRAYAFMDAHLR